jgi:Leucine-rich repeat (LRR) protein
MTLLLAIALLQDVRALEKELRDMGAKAVVEPDGRLTSISLYMKVDAHAKDYKLNSKVGDEWVSKLAGLPDLRSLDLENTELRGPGLKAVGTLKTLERLNLTLCPVDDAHFDALAGLTRVTSLGLASTKVRGEGLRHLTAWTALANLNCHNAPIDDPGLAAIGRLSSLTRLEIVHTRFSDAGAPALAGLLNLERLQLGSRAATGASLAVLASLPKLRELDVHDGMLSLEGWRHAAAIKTLKVLRAYGGQGEGLKELARHPELHTLLLESSGVTDLSVLKTLPKLRTLILKEPKLSKEAVDALRAAAPDLRIEGRNIPE